MYDITSKESFESLKYWVKSLRDEAIPELILMVVGNKVDLQED